MVEESKLRPDSPLPSADGGPGRQPRRADHPEATSASKEAIFEEIVREMTQELHRYISVRVGTPAAEDLLSDVFLVVWRRWENLPIRWDERRAWIYEVTKRTIADHHKRTARVTRLTHRLGWFREPHTNNATPEHEVLSQDHVARLLDTLPPGQAQALHLAVIQGYTARETAEILGVSATTITTRLMRARRTLRALLRQGEP